MNADNNKEECPEKSYWKSVSGWVKATQNRYSGHQRGDLTQCFMRGPFAGWSERQVAELADLLSQNATRFPLRGYEELDWGKAPPPPAQEGTAESDSVVSQSAREIEADTPTNQNPSTCPSDDKENESGDDDYCPGCRSCGEEGFSRDNTINTPQLSAAALALFQKARKLSKSELERLTETAGQLDEDPTFRAEYLKSLLLEQIREAMDDKGTSHHVPR